MRAVGAGERKRARIRLESMLKYKEITRKKTSFVSEKFKQILRKEKRCKLLSMIILPQLLPGQKGGKPTQEFMKQESRLCEATYEAAVMNVHYYYFFLLRI